MTSPQSEAFTASQANLALYGALDDILVQAIEEGEVETAVLVNQYLPGALEYPGWANELREIFGPVQPDSTDIAVTVSTALSGVLLNGESLTIPDLANLVYIVGALAHFDAADPGGNAGLFTDVLALAGIEGITESERLERASTFLTAEDGLVKGLYGWQAWPHVIQTAAENRWVSEIIAEVPQCSTSVVTVKGLECVAIDVELTSENIPFDDLLGVIDPRNWPKGYPAFFCEMYPAAARVPPDKWWNIDETVGFCPVDPDGGLGLQQRLRFLKSNQSATDARLDFDLAENQTGCTGKVLVDRGFVNVTCTHPDGNTSKGGVRLKTKKVAHIKGISPYAQAFWLCKLGYGWVALHLFFGLADDPPKDCTEWKDEPVIDEPDNDPPDENDENDEDGDGGAGGAVGFAGADDAPPADDELAVATKTAKRLAEVANYVTATNLDLTKRWLDGGLNFGDLAKYGQEVGGKLAGEPWKWLQEITTAAKPSKPPGGTP